MPCISFLRSADHQAFCRRTVVTLQTVCKTNTYRPTADSTPCRPTADESADLHRITTCLPPLAQMQYDVYSPETPENRPIISRHLAETLRVVPQSYRWRDIQAQCRPAPHIRYLDADSSRRLSADAPAADTPQTYSRQLHCGSAVIEDSRQNYCRLAADLPQAPHPTLGADFVCPSRGVCDR